MKRIKNKELTLDFSTEIVEARRQKIHALRITT